MPRYIKKCFFTAITFFSSNVLNVNSLKCVSMNNQECKIRTEIISLNTNERLFYRYSIKINKCKDSCITINSMIHMLNIVFLATLKTQILKYLICCQKLVKQDT